MASGIRCHFGDDLNDLAIRALLIQCAERGEQHFTEIGWGRCPRHLDSVVLCEDHEIRVVYQGEISPAKHIRAPIPLPAKSLKGIVKLRATLCYKSQTDPHHPGNYTRAGLIPKFRPDSRRFSTDEKEHPDTKSFFGSAKKYETEEELRRDAGKWENCLNSELRMRGTSLHRPVFDIHYNARMEGRDFRPEANLTYALVITVSAPRVHDLYDQVVRLFGTQLEPLVPRLELPIRT